MHFSFDQIGVSFRDNTTVLHNVSFDIEPGARLALIGKSGAGKTMCASLLRRDRDPTSGRVLLDGRDLREYNRPSVLRHLGVILQQPQILSGTVRENLCFGLAHRLPDDVLWDMVALVRPSLRDRFRDGLDTLVGKQGLQLSGGEQQSLCVMRALLRKPAFLIVDEATSSLDSETERVVQDGIDTALSQGIGALVIAHRFATLRRCTDFVVLRRFVDVDHDRGESQIEAHCASLKELEARSSTFRHLAAAQGFIP